MPINYLNDITGLSFFEQIALGAVWNKTWIYKFGRAKTVINKNVPVWDGSTNYIFPENAGIVTITSTEPDDDNATGDGARVIQVFGLDENWETAIDTIVVGEAGMITFIRVFRMLILENGTQDFPYDNSFIGNNVGDITATHADTGEAVAIILAGNGQTLMSIFTVPKGFVALMWSAKTEIGKGQQATGKLFSRDNSLENPAWRIRGIRDMYQNTVGNVFKIPTVYTEMTDILLSVIGDQNGNDVTATFQIELVAEENYQQSPIFT